MLGHSGRPYHKRDKEALALANDRVSGAEWAKGAAVLGIAATVSKLLGTLQKIPLQNVAGDGAFGIYSLVYPLYTLVLFLATAGFPVAVSAFVSERISSGDRAGAVRVLKVSVLLLILSGIAGFAFLFWGADVIAGWIGNDETVPAIRSVSFALLFVPIMAALRGYFQGGHDMVPTAVSQVIEQSVRVATMVLVLVLLTMHQMADAIVAAGATFGAVTGAIAGMAVMLVYWTKHYGAYRKVKPERATDKESFWKLSARLLRYAIPVCMGAVAVPVLGIVDSFTLPRLFESSMNAGDQEALVLFGIYARGLPLVQLVSMLASAIAVTLVPAIAEARVRRDDFAIKQRTELAIRATWMIGLAASVGLAVTALPVNWMLYQDGQGTSTMAILAFTAWFSALNITSAGILQGLGMPGWAAFSFMTAACLKVGLNVLLVPTAGMDGAAWSGVIAFGAAALFNSIAIKRGTRASFSTDVYIWRTGGSLLLMAAAAFLCAWGLPQLLDSVLSSARLIYTITALAAVLLGALVFGAALIRFRGITAGELALLPGARSRLLPLLRKLRWIKD